MSKGIDQTGLEKKSQRTQTRWRGLGRGKARAKINGSAYYFLPVSQSDLMTSSVTTDVTVFWLLGGRRVLFSKHRGVVDSVSRWISCLQSTLAHMMVFQCWKRDNFYLLCKRQAENFHLGLKKTEFSVSQWLLQNMFCIIMLHMDIKDRNTRPECFRITFSTCGRSEKQNKNYLSNHCHVYIVSAI